MFKKKKKVIYSLLAATILSSSAANAASYNLTNIDYGSRYSNYKRGYSINNSYNDYNNRYDYNYNNNSKVEQNTVVDKYPTFNWSVVNTKPSMPSRPTPPVTNEPEFPTNNPDYNWGNSNNKPTKPETPTQKPAEPVNPTPSVSGITSIEMEVIRLVNIERQKEGLLPFTASSALSNVARKKSEDMAKNNYFSHTSPTYGSPFDMMRSFGIKYNTAGENIAKGQLSAQSVVNGWMNSSGHRANIMNPSFKTIGVGHYQSSNGTNLWTQMFTN